MNNNIIHDAPRDAIVENHYQIENIPLDKITVKTIRNLIFPPTESDREVATIKIPAYVHENIHKEAAERGLSIVDFIVTMLDFFLGSVTTPILHGDVSLANLGVNSHLLTHEIDTESYEKKERIWQEDLQKIVSEHDNWARYSKAIEIA